MDEILKEMADEAGIEHSGGLPRKGGEAIPEPEAVHLESGDWVYTWSDPSGEMIRARTHNPSMQARDLWVFLTVAHRQSEHAEPVTLLAHMRWNVRSLSHTNSIVTALNRSLNRNWDGRLTQIHTHLELNFQFGDDAVWLDEVPDPGPLEYLISPLVERGQHSVIAADGGSLKSLIAEACAISLAEGLTICPGMAVATKMKTLYLDYETDRHVHARRYRQLLAGIEHGELAQMVMYKRLYAPLVDAAEDIRQLILKHGFGFVVVDSASRAVGGETVSESDTIPYFNAVSSWGITALTIAHKSKSNSAGPAGNAQWRNQARSYWEVAKDQVEGDDTVRIALTHQKSNNGQLFRPIGLAVKFSDEAIVFKKSDPAESAVIAEKLPLVEQVRNYLLGEPNSTAAEIGDALGQSQNRVNNILKSQEGKVFRGSEERRNRRWAVLSNPVINAVDNGGRDPLGGSLTPSVISEGSEQEKKHWWDD